MRVIACGIAALLLASLGPARAETVDGGRYGQVRIAVPEGEIGGYVVYFSGRDGWEASDDRAIAAMAIDGALAVGVDTKAYMSAIASSGKVCDQLVGDAEMLSRQLQKVHPATQYQFPILAGHGAGGTLAYAILAQAPQNTLSGAVSLDPRPDLQSGIPLCPGTSQTKVGEGRFAYGPKRDLDGFLTLGLSGEASDETRAYVNDLDRGHVPMTLKTIGHDADPEDLAFLVEPHLEAARPLGLAALPLIPMPADHPSDLMAIVLAGDGGWRDIDKVIAEKLREQGVSVVGWDSLRYFWREKSPDQTAVDLADVVQTFSERWHADKVALIGYSFGADVLPFAYDLLPDGVKRKVAMVSLLGLEAKADWAITVSGWLGQPPSDQATPIAPALANMPSGLIQCFYGVEEQESACPSLDTGQAELIKTSGGHHFGHDYDAVTRDILIGFRKRADILAARP